MGTGTKKTKAKQNENYFTQEDLQELLEIGIDTNYDLLSHREIFSPVVGECLMQTMAEVGA